jgi:drug/metabolite transporter (DMT)-like permease
VRAWLLLATAFWGLSFPLGKAVALGLGAELPGADAWLLTTLPLTWRFLLAAVVLLVLFRRGALPARGAEWLHGAVLGVCCGAGLLFQMTGLQSVDASVSAFLTQLGCVLVPLLVALDQRAWPRRRVWAAVVLVLAGGAVLVELDLRNLQLAGGEVLTLLGTLAFAVQVYWLGRGEVREVRMLPCTWVMFLVIGVLFGVVSAVRADEALALVAPLAAPAVWVPVLGLTLFCTAGAFGLMNRFQPRVGASEAGVIYGMESVFAALLALWMPGVLSLLPGIAYANETLTWNVLVGGVGILAATALVTLPAAPLRAAVARGGRRGPTTSPGP